jgi:hypothetical protein
MEHASTPRDQHSAEPLSAALARLIVGAREERLSLHEFLDGLSGRAYAFAIAAIDLPNCIPTGIPWLSTITGIPILLLLVQQGLRMPHPVLPDLLGRRSLPRGRLQAGFARVQSTLLWLERRVRRREEWLITALPGQLMFAAMLLAAVVLALPIPFDNLLPAWAVMFFALAQLERDGVMAILGWLATLATAAWTVLLLVVYGHAGVVGWGLLHHLWRWIVG